jgi:hypothetical protein
MLDNMKLILFGGESASDCITQDELDYVIGLQNKIRDMRRQHGIFAASIRRRIKLGARIEPGVHQAELIVEETGKHCLEKLKVR